MKSVCFFSSYFTGNKIPIYIKFYLQELSRHFTEIIFITNEKVLDGESVELLDAHKIQLLTVTNEGYDFGMWYKALKKYNISGYDRVGLINDSCILFGKLDPFFEWLSKEDIDFAGFTDSYLLNYHIQSYFLVIDKNAIPFVLNYFTENGLITENDRVIKTYEIGLSQYIVNSGLQLKAMYPVPEKGEYNYALDSAKELIHKGFPLIKKKIIARSYVREKWWSMVVKGFDPFPSHYIKLIKNKYTVPVGMFEELTGKSLWFTFKFNIISVLSMAWSKLGNKRKLR